LDDQAFYSVAAQVIPVLFLALVFETRLLRSYADEPFANSVFFIGLFGAMLVGEVAALAALNGTAPSRLEKNMVWLALILGVLLVLGWPIWSRIGRVLGAVPPRVRRFGEPVLVLGVVVVALLVMLGVISEDWLSGIAAVLVVFFVVSGALLARFGLGPR
jgi:hypothetical protein